MIFFRKGYLRNGWFGKMGSRFKIFVDDFLFQIPVMKASTLRDEQKMSSQDDDFTY